jgi:hypothetical protein
VFVVRVDAKQLKETTSRGVVTKGEELLREIETT